MRALARLAQPNALPVLVVPLGTGTHSLAPHLRPAGWGRGQGRPTVRPAGWRAGLAFMSAPPLPLCTGTRSACCVRQVACCASCCNQAFTSSSGVQTGRCRGQRCHLATTTSNTWMQPVCFSALCPAPLPSAPPQPTHSCPPSALGRHCAGLARMRSGLCATASSCSCNTKRET